MLKDFINRLDEIERRVEDKTYTPSDVLWLVQELGEQSQANQDLLEVVASAYQNGFKDAQAGEDWRDDPIDVGRITFGRYQLESMRTLPALHGTAEEKKIRRLIAAMGLSGEAGEVLDHIKKIEGHGHEVDKKKLQEELGDVLWYVAALCTYYELDMDKAACGNIHKLRQRYPEGFSENASRERTV